MAPDPGAAADPVVRVGEPSVRLDRELVRRGLARSREQAAGLVRAGVVSVAGRTTTRPAWPVDAQTPIEVAATAATHFVSRGAEKLSGALDALPQIDPSGRRCLDAGASTGGFTQVLLERGAAHVVAVDVGHGQLARSIATDPRVTSYEGLHLRDLDLDRVGGPADLVVADLSFISLRHVMPVLAAATAPDGDLLPMVKPQFEVGRRRLGSGGVVRSDELRRSAVQGVADAAAEAGLAAVGLVASPTPGPAGNLEYFLWLRRGGTPVDLAAVWPTRTTS